MSSFLRSLVNDEPGSTKAKIIGLYILLLTFNLAVWCWAFVAFRRFPVLLGTAFFAFSFGLRHAVDADHIAAIDNVTRKLMQDGQRPVNVGFFFSLGHSLVVILASAAVAATAGAFKDKMDSWTNVGGIVSTCVSASFLLILALLNII